MTVFTGVTESFTNRETLEQSRKKVREYAILQTFQAEGTVSMLKKVNVQQVQGTAERLVWLEWSEPEE